MGVYRRRSWVRRPRARYWIPGKSIPAQGITLPLLGGAGYEAAVLADSPAVYYRLGEPSGSIVDTQGGSSGTANGGVTRDVTGALTAGDDGAIQLDGVDGYISVPDQTVLDVGDSFTLEVWTKRGLIGVHEEFLLQKGDGSFRLGFNNNGIEIAQKAVAIIAVSTVGVTDTTTWHHICWTKNGTTNVIYLDGSDVTGTVTNQTIVDTSDELQIGRSNTGYYTGYIDEVAIYDTALSAATIAAHYAAASEVGGAVLYAPTIVQGPATISLDLLDGGATLYAPTVTPKNTIDLGLLDGAATLYAPSLSHTITVPLLDGAAELYAPTLTPKNTIELGLLDGAAELYAPTLAAAAQSITIPLLDGGAALYEPSIGFTITVPLLDGAATLYAPSVGFTIALPLLDEGATLYAPSIGFTIALPLLDGAATLYAPEVQPDQFLTIPLLDGAAELYAPTLTSTALTIALDLLDGGATLYAPELIQDQFITLGLLDGGATLYAPDILQAQFLVLPLLDGAASLFAPSLTTTSVIIVPLLDGNAELYAPVLSQQQFLALPLLDAENALYPPTLAFPIVGGKWKWVNPTRAMAGVKEGGWPATQDGFTRTRKNEGEN